MAADAYRARAICAIVAGGCLLGVGPALVRVSEVGPIATAFWRFALSLPVFACARAIATLGAAPRVDDGRAGGVILLAGLMLATDLALWHWSIELTTVANATMMTNLAPVVVTLVGVVAFGLRPRPAFLVGLALAVAGAAALAFDSNGRGGRHLRGDALGAMSAVAYAVYLMAVVRARRDRGALAVMIGASLAAAAALLPVAASMEGRVAPRTPNGWLAVAALGIVVHVGGQGLIAYALADLPVAFGSVTLLLQPIVAALIAWAAFGEAMRPLQTLGAVAILAGIVAAGRAPSAIRATPTPPASSPYP